MPQELLDFPTDELIKIDKLWINHSHGKFGFSIQKKIYVRYGGNLNVKYSGDATVLNHFGEVIGWRRDKNWLNYENGMFNINAPIGHLPVCKHGGIHNILPYLLSHNEL